MALGGTLGPTCYQNEGDNSVSALVVIIQVVVQKFRGDSLSGSFLFVRP